jgi:hypothetical protein
MNSSLNFKRAREAISCFEPLPFMNGGEEAWSSGLVSEECQFLADVLCSLDETGQGNVKLISYWQSLGERFGSLLTPVEVSTISSELHSLFLCYSGFSAEQCPAYFVIDSLAESCARCESREACEVTSLLQLASDQTIEDGSPARLVFQRVYTRMAVKHVLRQSIRPAGGAIYISETTTRWLAHDLPEFFGWQENAKEWQLHCLAFLYGNALRAESAWQPSVRLHSLCEYLEARDNKPDQLLGFTPEILLPSGISFSRMVTPVSESEFKWQAAFTIPEVPQGDPRVKSERGVAFDLDFFADPTGIPEARAMQSLVGIPCLTPCYPADVHRADIVDAILSRKETLAWLVALDACRLSFSFPQLKEHYNERNNKGVYFLLLAALCWFQRYRVDKARNVAKRF